MDSVQVIMTALFQTPRSPGKRPQEASAVLSPSDQGCLLLEASVSRKEASKTPAKLQEDSSWTPGRGQEEARRRTQLQRTALLPGISWTKGFSTELYYSGAERLM